MTNQFAISKDLGNFICVRVNVFFSILFVRINLTFKFMPPWPTEIAMMLHRSLFKEKVFILVFFSIGVFFQWHWRLTEQLGQGKDHFLFHSTTSTRTRTFRYCLQLCTWDDYHIFLITPRVFTELPLDENYHLIELPFDWLMWC